MKTGTFSERLRLIGLTSVVLATVAQADQLYVANTSDNSISVINTETRDTLASIVVSRPHSLAVTPDGSRVLTDTRKSGSDQGQILFIDSRANSIIGSPIPVGSGVADIAITPDGQKALITNSLNMESTISTIDMASAGTIGKPVRAGCMPGSIALEPGAKTAIVTQGYSSLCSKKSYMDGLIRFSISQNRVIGGVKKLCSLPRGIGLSLDGSHAYVACNQQGVMIVGTAGRLSRKGHIQTGAKGSNEMVVSPDGSRAYITNYGSNSVSVINPNTSSLVTTIAVGKGPYGIAINADGSRVFVSNSAENTVSVINTQTNALIGDPIAVGKYPTGLVVVRP